MKLELARPRSAVLESAIRPLSPAKTKILSGTIAAVMAVITIPLVAVGVMLAWNLLPREIFDRDTGVQWLIFLALGASLVSAFAVFRGVYNGLCERWSDEIEPPRMKRWPPLHRPF